MSPKIKKRKKMKEVKIKDFEIASKDKKEEYYVKPIIRRSDRKLPRETVNRIEGNNVGVMTFLEGVE